MTLTEAYTALELDYQVDNAMLKEQYRWWIKFCHPDNPKTGDARELRKIIEAYQVVLKVRENV